MPIKANENTIRESVRSFIACRLEEHGVSVAFTDEQSLIHSAMLDSLALIYLIVFLEETFQVDFSLLNFDEDNFDTVNGIVKLVVAYQSN